MGEGARKSARRKGEKKREKLREMCPQSSKVVNLLLVKLLKRKKLILKFNIVNSKSIY